MVVMVMATPAFAAEGHRPKEDNKGDQRYRAKDNQDIAGSRVHFLPWRRYDVDRKGILG